MVNYIKTVQNELWQVQLQEYQYNMHIVSS